MKAFRIDVAQIGSFVKRESLRRIKVISISFLAIMIIIISAYENPVLRFYSVICMITASIIYLIMCIYTPFWVRKKALKTVIYIDFDYVQRRLVEPGEDVQPSMIDGKLVYPGKLDTDIKTPLILDTTITKDEVKLEQYYDYTIHNRHRIRVPRELENYDDFTYFIRKNSIRFRYILNSSRKHFG